MIAALPFICPSPSPVDYATAQVPRPLLRYTCVVLHQWMYLWRGKQAFGCFRMHFGADLGKEKKTTPDLGPKLRRFGMAPPYLVPTPRAATGEFWAQPLVPGRPCFNVEDG